MTVDHDDGLIEVLRRKVEHGAWCD